MKAITPQQAQEGKDNNIPDVVLEVFNQLIKEHYRDGESTVRQTEVVVMLARRGLKRNVVFDRGWLDIESIYRKAGWNVRYDQPAFNESYPATFTFSKKR